MSRVIVGAVLVFIGILLALAGHPLLGADLHPVATGLIGIGIVAGAVGWTERRAPRPTERHWDERVR